MTIKAIIFDLDDTLVVEVASANAAFNLACKLAFEKYGIDPDKFHQTIRKTARTLWYASPSHPYCKEIGISSWEGLWARFRGDNPNLIALRKWSPTYRLQSWSNALKEFGIDDDTLAEQLSETFQTERRKRHIVFDDAQNVLDELRKQYQLALVSNGAPGLQREKLNGSGLAHYFAIVIISGEIGIGKPDPKLFEITLEKLRVKPNEAVVIGNARGTDILGAKNANIKAIWLNRDNSDYDSDVIPDFQIAKLNQLPALLNSF